jgi:hypothetical protein
MSSMYRMQVVKSPLVSQKKYSEKKRLQVQVETGILKSENLILNRLISIWYTILLRYQKDLITTI